MHEEPLALRVRRPEALREALAEAPTFEAEELLARIDRLARDLSSNPERKVDHIRLYCDALGSAPSDAELASTWTRLCEAKALAYRRLAEATRRDGWVALRYGALCFAAALAVSVALHQWEPLPSWINRPLTEGFTIAAWVSLWRPFELLLYEWLPFGRMAKTFDRLGPLPVAVAPAESAPAASH